MSWKIRAYKPVLLAAFLPLLYDWNGFIASPTALQKWGDNDFGVHPVGAGPFRFVEHQDGVRTVIERRL